MKNADLRQLALFCELIDTQSLNEAAARMHMSASAASQSLTRLRHAVADDLCVRGQNRYQLTPYAEQALPAFRQMLALWRDTSTGHVRFDPRLSDARMALACDEGGHGVGLADFVRRCLAQAPGLSLDIHAPCHGPRDIEDLRTGAIDVVCTHQAPPDDARDLHMETLCRIPITLCCMRTDHPRIGSAVSIDAYLAEAHLTVGGHRLAGTALGPVDSALRAMGQPVRRCSAVPTWALCAELLATTDHLLSASDAQAAALMGLSPHIRCLPLPDGLLPAEWPLHMLWHQRTHQSKPHRWLRQRLGAHMAGRTDTTAIRAGRG